MKDRYKYGIGSCSGAGIYSLINMIMNLNHRSQREILVYDFIITGVAVFGLILSIYLLKKRRLKYFPYHSIEIQTNAFTINH